MYNENEIKALQAKENELWDELKALHPDTADEAKRITSELIELNLTLEQSCNE